MLSHVVVDVYFFNFLSLWDSQFWNLGLSIFFCAQTTQPLLPAQAHPDAFTEKRLAVRLALADSSAQCSVVVYHDLVLALAEFMAIDLGTPLQDNTALRHKLRDMFRSAQWLCRFTFRANDFQEILELDLRHMAAYMWTTKSNAVLPPQPYRSVPHCHASNTGCPVAALRDVRADPHLGLLTVHNVEGTSVRALVAFNGVELPDDEALQQDPTTTSAMRVKRSVDCLLSPTQDGTGQPFRAKLRCAGPASAVNWMLRGAAGQVFQVVLSQAEDPGEWTVLWYVEVCSDHVSQVAQFWAFVSKDECCSKTLFYDSNATPQKRLCALRDAGPESSAW